MGQFEIQKIQNYKHLYLIPELWLGEYTLRCGVVRFWLLIFFFMETEVLFIRY